MIVTALNGLSKHATIAFAVGMVVALTMPPITAVIGPGLPVWIFTMLTLSVIRTNTSALAGHLRRPIRSISIIVWMLVLSPVAIGSLVLFLDLTDMLPLADALIVPLLFYTAMPPLTAVPALALLFGIDAALAVVVLMGASLLTPFVLPPIAVLVLGINVDIGMGELFTRLAILVFGSFCAGVIIRKFAGTARVEQHSKSIDGIIVLDMVFIVIAVFDGVHTTMWQQPELALSFVALAFCAAIFFQIFSAILFSPFGRVTALTAGMVSGNRNQALLLAALGGAATIEIALFVALAQLPVYLLPMIQRPLAKRFGYVSY